jgi:hypothetical protein
MSLRYKALLVGAHRLSADPENLPALHGPPHDVPALRAALSHRETGLVAAADITSVMNPTKAEAEHAIHEFFSAGRRDDVLVFYFSGHGRLTRENKLFLCATDTVTARLPVTGIAATTLRDCMEASEAPRLVVILDCCHSGAFRGGALPSDAIAGRGAFLLSSARAHQLADDGDGQGPSPFTAAIVDALQDPASDIDGDGLITFDNVYRVVYARLAPRKQFPQRSTGEGTVALSRCTGTRAVAPLARSEPILVAPRTWPRSSPEGSRAGNPGERAAPEVATAARGSVLAALHAMEVCLLSGYAADVVVHATAVAAAALKVIIAAPQRVSVDLADLADQLHRAGRTELASDASWLDQCRTTAAPFLGQIHGELDDDARRARDIALRFAAGAGLVSEAQSLACQRSAAWQASRPTPSALLRLDRANHRKVFDDLVEMSRRVLVLLVHGEIGQGHDHFGEVMTWRLRSNRGAGCREIAVNWPPPLRSLGSRLAMLFEDLATALGVALAIPAEDPTTSDGAQVWQAALAPVHAAIDAGRERLLLRHALRWLGTGSSGDDALVDRYVRAIWARVASRPGERVVVSLELRRIEHGGVPLSKAWRTGRSELSAARAITATLEQLDLHHGGLCVALPELTSVTAHDLVDWLRLDGGRRRDDAESEADALVSSTRGGRFDLLVERLTALHLDRQRAGK